MNEQPDPHINTNTTPTTTPAQPMENPTPSPTSPPPVTQPEGPQPDSRLKEHVKKQTLRNVLLALGGVIVIGGILLLFGSDLLIGLSLLLGKNSTQQPEARTTNNPAYIAPPVLNAMEDATKSASISIEGSTTNPSQMVYLYVNGKLEDKIKSKKNKNFTFRSVLLKEGENKIKAKTVSEDNKQSDYSNTITIIYNNKPPQLAIDSPLDGQTFKKDQSPIEIRGKTDEGVRVTVNDFWAIDEGEGKFLYNYTLKDGENKIKIVATDDASNNTEKEITIKVE